MNSFRWHAPALAVALAAMTLCASYQGGPRRMALSKLALVLDDRFAGWVEQGQGLRQLAERSDSDSKTKRGGLPTPLGGITALSINGSVASNLLDWVEQSWNQNYQRKNGAVQTCGERNNVQSIFEFQNARITQIAFPPMDRMRNDYGSIQIQFQPESSSTRKGGANDRVQTPPGMMPKYWMPGNFKLEIDGLDCRNASRVGPIATGGRVALMPARRLKGAAAKGDPKMEFPNLSFMIPESDFKKSLNAKWNGPEYDANKIMRGKLTVPDNKGKGGYRFTFQTVSLKATKSDSGMVAVQFKTSLFKLEFF